jgi:hypothetical protein
MTFRNTKPPFRDAHANHGGFYITMCHMNHN